jgi:hypothetical protein
MLVAANFHALANPIAFPSHLTGEVGLLALVAMFAEIQVGSRLLRRITSIERPTAMLVKLNALSWITFFLLVNSLSPTAYPAWRTVACLEGCVVLVEFQVLWLVVRASNALRPDLRHAMAKVFAVSLIANMVSIAISILPWILALAA